MKLIENMTREELQAEIAEIDKTIPELREAFNAARQEEQRAREELNALKKSYALTQRAAGMAENRFKGAREQMNNLKRALEDLIAQEETPMNWPVVRSKIHARQPGK